MTGEKKKTSTEKKPTRRRARRPAQKTVQDEEKPTRGRAKRPAQDFEYDLDETYGIEPLWRLQPWDTDVSYERFKTYYLAQDPPRTLSAAYRKYMADKRSKIDPKAPPSTQWKAWASGIPPGIFATTQKRPVTLPDNYKDAKTWKERAGAWDRYQAAIEEAAWARRRKQVFDAEWELAEALFERVRKMQAAPLFKVTTGEDGRTVIEPTEWREGDISAGLKTASAIARRAAGLPESSKEMKHDWAEKVAGMGVNPDNLLSQVSALIAENWAVNEGYDPTTSLDETDE